MNLLSKAACEAVQRITKQDTYMGGLLQGGYISGVKKRRQKYTTVEMLSGMASNHRPDTAPLVLTKYDEHLNIVGSSNLLRIHRGRYTVRQGRAVYVAKCKCGGRVSLIAQEVIARNRAEVGCCRPGCTAPDMSKRIWYDPAAALGLQLGQLVARHPGLVSRQWTEQTLFEGVQAMSSEVKRRAPTSAYGSWWFKGVKEHGLNDVEDIEFAAYPSKWILPRAGVVALWEGELTSIEEVAEAYGVEVQEAMKLRIIYFDESMINELIGE